MKILTVLGALVAQCAAAKSWNNDGYSEETYSVFGWICYLKRISLIVLIFSCVILYYVPESRPHARRMCYSLIDLTANGLKSALCTRDSDYMYEKIKAKYDYCRYDPSLLSQRRVSEDIQSDDEDHERVQKNYRKSKIFVEADGISENKERKKGSTKQAKERKQSRHSFRHSIMKNPSAEPSMEVAKPLYFYSDKLEDLQKYLKTNLSGAKRADGKENYAFLISGSPQQIAMLDRKCEKDDVVIVQEPYLRVEYKERGTCTDKTEGSGSEQEGPTRDNNNRARHLGMDTYVNDVEPSSTAEKSLSRYSVSKSLCESTQFQCGGGCCGPNGCSVSSANLSSTEGVKNVLKSSRSMSAQMHKSTDRNNENIYVVDYDNYREKEATARPIHTSGSRKVDFREEDIIYGQQKQEGAGYRYEDTYRVRRKKTKQNDPLRDFYCKDISYFADRGGDIDDEYSQLGAAISKDDLDERPERERALYENDSDESILDSTYDDLYTEPMLKNRLKPALIRAVNWIFGGCSEASRRAALKRGHVGKEENRELIDEWLH